ncbi:MAG: PmoA family protein [Candidatus Sumerlaeia bacterium]|nr:PmoA family protein [Candidatus Sumerlaeia bacterium]
MNFHSIAAIGFQRVLSFLPLLLCFANVCAQAAQPRVEFTSAPGQVAVSIGGQPVAVYVFADPKIPRPYFAHLRAPGGIQVTRNHPPIAGKDATDHDMLHPGLWMAFSELSGCDYWRNKNKVVHKEFVQPPTGGEGKGAFAVCNLYMGAREDEPPVAREICRIAVHVRPAGYLVVWESVFATDRESCVFGDQEEMGLGVRLATPLIEKSGGTVVNSAGVRRAKTAWGRPAEWCDYSGVLDGKRAGIVLMCDPSNFRPSRFHVRDYGLMAANPFGRKVFGGEPSTVAVRRGETLRLRYGVLLYAIEPDAGLDCKAAFADFLQVK